MYVLDLQQVTVYRGTRALVLWVEGSVGNWRLRRGVLLLTYVSSTILETSRDRERERDRERDRERNRGERREKQECFRAHTSIFFININMST